MMYQPEIEQQQPSQIGLIKEKIQQSIAQIPKMIEQHGQKKCQFVQQTPYTIVEQRISKDYLMSEIKNLINQVQDILVGQEQQFGKIEHEDLLKQMRNIQYQVQNMMISDNQTQKKSEIPEKQRTTTINSCKTIPREHKQIREMIPFELFVECQPTKYEQTERRITGEQRVQLIEKLIQQVKILEEMLVEKQYDITYQMPKMEQFYFEMEKELFGQIKKRFFDLEDKICFGYEQVVEQKLRKLFSLLRQQIQQIEEILYPISGQYMQGKNMLKTKEQCQQMLEKIRKFRFLMQEIANLICPETYELKQYETILPVQNMSKLYDLINFPFKTEQEEEIYNGKQYFGNNKRQQQEGEQLAILRRELDSIKMAKHELEMKLFETNKKFEQFKQQIEMMEQCPKHEQEQECCFKPTQQPTWYTTVEPKCEMMIKSKNLMGEQKQQHHFEKQQPMTKFF